MSLECEKRLRLGYVQIGLRDWGVTRDQVSWIR